jgi:hypothetical protein
LLSLDEIGENGLLFYLVFDIKDDVATSDTFSFVTLQLKPGHNFINGAYADVAAEFVPGGIEIVQILDPTADDLDYDTNQPWLRTYNGSAQTVPVTSSVLPDSALTVYYEGFLVTDYTKSTTGPTDVGFYRVSVDIAESPGYNAASDIALGYLVISKAAAPTFDWPTASDITYGQALSNTALSATSNAYGAFAWGSSFVPTDTPDAGDHPYPVVFTPSANTIKNYESITPLEKNVVVHVNKAAAPVIATWPTASSILVGQTLAGSTLAPLSNEYGDFVWTDDTIALSYPGGDYEVTFVPSAATLKNYEAIAAVTHNVHVTAVILGDTDGDGYVDVLDALRVLRAVNGQLTLTGDELLGADIDGDGLLTSADVVLIMRKAMGL